MCVLDMGWGILCDLGFVCFGSSFRHNKGLKISYESLIGSSSSVEMA